MKKIIFVILIMVCFASNASSATFSNIKYFTVSTITFPDEILRSPSQNSYAINAIYYSDFEFLNISFLENLGFGSIVIYRNGNEIISEFGSGEYVIVITTGYGDIYVGTFDKNHY